MALVAYDPTMGELEPFVSEAPGVNEGSRIVAMAIFKVGFDPSVLTEVSTTWDAGLTAGDIEIIKPISGNMARPTENTIPGKGFIETIVTSRSFDVPVTHYGVDSNLAMWNRLNQSVDDYSVGFVFEDMKMFLACDRDLNLVPMTISAAPESEETLGNKRQFAANVKWKTVDLPYSIEVPSSLFR